MLGVLESPILNSSADARAQGMTSASGDAVVIVEYYSPVKRGVVYKVG